MKIWDKTPAREMLAIVTVVQNVPNIRHFIFDHFFHCWTHRSSVGWLMDFLKSGKLQAPVRAAREGRYARSIIGGQAVRPAVLCSDVHSTGEPEWKFGPMTGNECTCQWVQLEDNNVGTSIVNNIGNMVTARNHQEVVQRSFQSTFTVGH